MNQLEHFQSAQARRLVQKALKNLQAQIEQANQKLKALIAQEAPTALLDPKGRFPDCLEPQLSLTRNWLDLYQTTGCSGGCRPFSPRSWLRCAKGSIRGGRAKLRSRLYMAALVASGFDSFLGDVYQCLIRRGNPKKLPSLLSIESSSSPCITSLKNLCLFFPN